MRKSAVASFAALCLAPTPALAQLNFGAVPLDCVAALRHAGNSSQVCTYGQMQAKDAVEISQLNQLNSQTQQLAQLIAAVQELTKANHAFRQSFEKVVVQQQSAMRDDVVAQLSAIPGQVATNQAIIDALAVAVATKLARDPAFQDRLKAEAVMKD